MGIKKLIMILATLGLATTAFADNHEGENKPFEITGDFAASMSFWDNEFNGDPTHDDFVGDLVEFNIEKNWSKSNFLMTVGFGNTANTVNGTLTPPTGDTANASGVSRALNLLQARYRITTSYGLGFQVGKWESPVGHETYNHMDNAQYTRSFGFALAPYFNTGAMVDYRSDMWKVGLMVTNGAGSDMDISDANKTMSLVVDIDPIENLHIDLNYVTGTEGPSNTAGGQANPAQTYAQISILDVSVAYMINEMFDVALNYIDHGQKAGATDNKANSIAAYVNANFGMFGLGLRYEQYSYDYGIFPYNNWGTTAATAAPAAGTPGTDNSINSITLAAKAELDQNAMVLLEYRMDTSDDQIYNDKDGVVPTDSENRITAAVMYRF